MMGNYHVRFGAGENPAITSKDYLSPFFRCSFEHHRFSPPFSGQVSAAGMNLRLKLVRYFVLGGVFRIPSVYLMGETAKKGKV